MDASLENQFNQLSQALDALKQSMDEKLESARQEASERSDRRQVAPPLQAAIPDFEILCVYKPKFNSITHTWFVSWKESDGITVRPYSRSYAYEFGAQKKYRELLLQMEANAAD